MRKILAAALAILALSSPVLAQTSGVIYGVANVGSSTPSPLKPVVIGGSDGSLIRAWGFDASSNGYVTLRSGASALTDANGIKVQGSVADGATAAGNPVAIAGVDSSGKVQVILTDGAGRVVDQPIDFRNDAVTPISPTNSNAGTAVTIQAASGSTVIYLGTMLFTNQGTVAHTVTVQSSGGTGITKFRLSADGSFVLDGRGDWRALPGQGLQFLHDGAGGATDIIVSGAVVQK